MVRHLSKERMLDVSDKYSVYICNCCNFISPGNKNENIFECNKCENYSDFKNIYTIRMQTFNTINVYVYGTKITYRLKN